MLVVAEGVTKRTEFLRFTWCDEFLLVVLYSCAHAINVHLSLVNSGQVYFLFWKPLILYMCKKIPISVVQLTHTNEMSQFIGVLIWVV